MSPFLFGCKFMLVNLLIYSFLLKLQPKLSKVIFCKKIVNSNWIQTASLFFMQKNGTIHSDHASNSDYVELKIE